MNAKSLLYVALPVVLIGVLYVILKPQSAPDPAATPPSQALAPAPSPTPPSGGSGQPSKAEPATPPTQPSSPPPAQSSAAAAAPAATAAPAAEAKPTVVEIVVRNNKLVSGPAVIKVRKDDEVTLSITADKTDKLHLHGYDLHADLTPGKPATLKFKANLTGRFTYELHHGGVELGALEVFPR